MIFRRKKIAMYYNWKSVMQELNLPLTTIVTGKIRGARVELYYNGQPLKNPNIASGLWDVTNFEQIKKCVVL